MRFRKYFLTGLIAIAPIGASLFVAWFLIVRVGNILGQIFQKIPTFPTLPSFVTSFLGFIAILLLIYFIGLITSNFFGRWILSRGEWVFTRLPLVKTIYTSAKELAKNLFGERTAFRKAVFIQFPRKGFYTLAFITGEPKWSLTGEREKKGINIFVPTCPNPTSGYFIIVPEDEVIHTELSVETALKIIISGGMVVPEKRVIRTTDSF
ncbi:DUF502 domain-containing protein [candidate division TA06 bacterium]|nr:DUF502 domain-containing protein [candidate division TA06 bacterium]